MNQSVLIREGFNAETYLHDVPVFTIGNGMLGIRGFYEEDHAGTGGLGGIYMAGILAKGAYEPWAGLPRELVNIPNMLDVHISLNQEEIRITQETINMRFIRWTWKTPFMSAPMSTIKMASI